MYGSYTMESLNRIISTIDVMHNKTTKIEKLSTRIFNELVYSLFSMLGITQFTTKMLLYLHTTSEK